MHVLNIFQNILSYRCGPLRSVTKCSRVRFPECKMGCPRSAFGSANHFSISLSKNGARIVSSLWESMFVRLYVFVSFRMSLKVRFCLLGCFCHRDDWEMIYLGLRSSVCLFMWLCFFYKVEKKYGERKNIQCQLMVILPHHLGNSNCELKMASRPEGRFRNSSFAWWTRSLKNLITDLCRPNQ